MKEVSLELLKSSLNRVIFLFTLRALREGAANILNAMTSLDVG